MKIIKFFKKNMNYYRGLEKKFVEIAEFWNGHAFNLGGLGGNFINKYCSIFTRITDMHSILAQMRRYGREI